MLDAKRDPRRRRARREHDRRSKPEAPSLGGRFAVGALPAKLHRAFPLGEQRPLLLAWDPGLMRRRPKAKAVIDKAALALE